MGAEDDGEESVENGHRKAFNHSPSDRGCERHQPDALKVINPGRRYPPILGDCLRLVQAKILVIKARSGLVKASWHVVEA